MIYAIGDRVRILQGPKRGRDGSIVSRVWTTMAPRVEEYAVALDDTGEWHYAAHDNLEPEGRSAEGRTA